MVDTDLTNNSISYEFVLRKQIRKWLSCNNCNSYHTNYVSKASSSPVDNRVQAVEAYLPNQSQLNSFECGAVYYFESSSMDSMTIDSIDFRYYLDSSFVGDSTQLLIFSVYDVRNHFNTHGQVSDNDLTNINVGIVELKGLGTTIRPGTYNLATCTNVVNAVTGGSGVAMNTRYCYIIENLYTL